MKKKMEIMKTCCFEVSLNLESLSNCSFLNEIFFSYFISNFGKNLFLKIDIKTKTDKKKII